MSFHKLPEKLYNFGEACESTGKILAGVGMFLGGIMFLVMCSGTFLTFLVLGFLAYLLGVIIQAISGWFIEEEGVEEKDFEFDEDTVPEG